MQGASTLARLANGAMAQHNHRGTWARKAHGELTV